MAKIPYKPIIEGAGYLSLGISIVVAILLGVGLGVYLYQMFGHIGFIFGGLALGIGAAISNVYKAYKKHARNFEEYEQEAKNIQNAIDKNSE